MKLTGENITITISGFLILIGLIIVIVAIMNMFGLYAGLFLVGSLMIFWGMVILGAMK